MKRVDATEFAKFMATEAGVYERALTKEEIATYFENFNKVTMEDFRKAWAQHKADEKYGRMFPRIVDLQRSLKLVNKGVASDGTCAIKIEGTGERCKYPGSIAVKGSKFICRAHYRCFAHPGSVSSDSIIEASRDFTPPKTDDEIFAYSEQLKAVATKESAAIRAKIESQADTGPRDRILPPEVLLPVDDIERRIADAIDHGEANRDAIMDMAHQAHATVTR
jgi:hypothetical protein